MEKKCPRSTPTTSAMEGVPGPPDNGASTSLSVGVAAAAGIDDDNAAAAAAPSSPPIAVGTATKVQERPFQTEVRNIFSSIQYCTCPTKMIEPEPRRVLRK